MTDGSRVMAVAKEIGKLGHRIAEAVVAEGELANAAALREFMLTPAEGWPGTNDKARDAAKKTACAADAGLQQELALLSAKSKEIKLLNADMVALEAERRGIETWVRLQLARALLGDFNAAEIDGVVDDKVLDQGAEKVLVDTPTLPGELIDKEGLIDSIGFPPKEGGAPVGEPAKILANTQYNQTVNPVAGDLDDGIPF